MVKTGREVSVALSVAFDKKAVQKVCHDYAIY